MTDSAPQPEENTGDHFEIGYVPGRYDDLEPSADGRWFNLSVNGEEIGRMWTDSVGGLGLVQKPGASGNALSRVYQQIDRYKKLGFPAETVFDAMRIFTGYSASGFATGKLSAIEPYPITADGEKEPVGRPMEVDDEGISSEDLPEYNFIAIDENDEVVGAGRSTHTALLMRDGKNWVPLPEDDLRFDGCEWIEVDDAGLSAYDKRIETGLAFTREDLEDPIT